MVANESNGSWGQANELTLPANAITTSSQLAAMSAVSCTGAGSCVAGGSYVDSSDDFQAMVATETNGSWGQASELTLPANTNTTDPLAAISSVSCTSAGSCVAGGSYADSSDAHQAMVATETDGSRGQASELAPPANANITTFGEFAVISGVSCTSAGYCVADGSYGDNPPPPPPGPRRVSQAMVVSSVGSLSLSSASLPSGVVGSAYDARLSATRGAGSYTWSLLSGSLPAGLSLSSSGVISGTLSAAGTQSVEVQVSDPGPPAQQADGTVSITIHPASTRTIVARFGDQRISLTIPSGCVAPSSELPVKFASTKRSRGAKLRFTGVVFYLDRGVKHKVHKLVRGKHKLVTVYLPDATRFRQPAGLNLSVGKLKAGTNTLKVVVRYTKIIRDHRHKKPVAVTRTLRVNFSVC
jgi:cytochrome c551/c552